MAAIDKRERVTPDFTKRICTAYRSLVPDQASSYYDRLNTLLVDAQLRKEYLSGYRIRVNEIGHFLRANEVKRNEKRGAPTCIRNVMIMWSIFLRHLKRCSSFSLPYPRFKIFHLVTPIKLCVGFFFLLVLFS